MHFDAKLFVRVMTVDHDFDQKFSGRKNDIEFEYEKKFPTKFESPEVWTIKSFSLEYYYVLRHGLHDIINDWFISCETETFVRSKGVLRQARGHPPYIWQR